MNIYFACSITGGREFEPVYQVLMDALLADGHEIPTSHLADSTVVDLEGARTPREVYDRDVNWIAAADVLIAEVSVPSHGVGYEIGHALGLGKPVLCLAQHGTQGIQDDHRESAPRLADADLRGCERGDPPRSRVHRRTLLGLVQFR